MKMNEAHGNGTDYPLEPHMVELGPSGLYTSVFSVLCYCGESLSQKIFSAKALPTKRMLGFTWLNCME